MKIKFRNSMEDLIAFNRFHLSKSPMAQRNKRRSTIFYPVLFAVMILLSFLILKDVVVLTIGIICLAAYVAYFYLYYMKLYPRNVRKIYEETDNKTLFCEYSLRFQMMV